MAGITIIFDWFGTAVTRQYLAKLYNASYNTVCAIIVKHDGDNNKIKKSLESLKTRRAKQQNAVLYPYKDGSLLTLAEMSRLEGVNPHTIRSRFRAHPGDYDKIFHKGQLPRSIKGKKSSTIDDSWIEGLGPRRSIESVSGPTTYESEMWGG